ncbi:MAG: exopolysaccharide biosynthesis polyprenyl glycosylphosphotransferase [Hyphomicrobium sp.]
MRYPNGVDGMSGAAPTRLAVSGAGLGLAGLALELATIMAASVVTGIGYHCYAYGDAGPTGFFLAAGGLAGLIYTAPYVLAEQYRIQDFLEGRRSVGRGFLVWNYTFLCLAILAFLTKTTEDFSRGWMLLFYLAGLGGIIAFEATFRRLLRSMMSAGRITFRRMMLIGPADEVRRFASDRSLQQAGCFVVATMALPRIAPAALDTDDEQGSLEGWVEQARALQVDDIVILTDWSRIDLMERIVEAFSSLPVEIHLGASSLVGRFTDARVSRISSLTTLSLTAPALGPLQSFVKRGGDLLGALLALALLSPVLATIALLIRADSSGPVFFRQRRNGFNGREFQIWKFRTMTTLEDGEDIVQARPGDLRVTRVGRVLRRFNLDELPQLINVLRGEMSLVGPRPHAVAHDRHFGRTIASYSRRLNVLPGITGWAQVNGSRGLTDTEEAMRQRVAFDLYYIENWSVALDLYILALTLFSPRAFRNAH